ncbi:MAG: Veg protein [Firmicutes bacterium]|nr:Veg protein [Bacillota bacterium]
MPAQNAKNLDTIKKDLEANVGRKIKLRANRGRRRMIEAEGVLEQTYPKLFVVKLDKSNAVRRLSYTYADVLTETVEITIGDKQIGAAL